MRAACSRILGFVLLLLFASLDCAVLAQRQPEAQNSQITREFVNTTVTALQSLIEEHYFDIAATPKIESALQAALSRGDFNRATDASRLANLLTTTLYEATHDKHLFVSPVSPVDAAPGRAESGRLSNYGIRAAEVLDGNIGYLKITAFYRPSEAADTLDSAMTFLARADALILDLRENGGGSPDTAVRLLSYFFAEPDLVLFRVVPRSGEAKTYRTALIKPALRNASRPVYVLISGQTWSAGEGVAFILQERHRALVIGERTAGAANPAGPWTINDLLSVTIPYGQIKTAIREGNWEENGVLPDMSTAPGDALQSALIRALESSMRESKRGLAQEVITKALAKVRSRGCIGR